MICIYLCTHIIYLYVHIYICMYVYIQIFKFECEISKKINFVSEYLNIH